jgi:hypothetical protein
MASICVNRDNYRMGKKKFLHLIPQTSFLVCVGGIHV